MHMGFAAVAGVAAFGDEITRLYLAAHLHLHRTSFEVGKKAERSIPVVDGDVVSQEETHAGDLSNHPLQEHIEHAEPVRPGPVIAPPIDNRDHWPTDHRIDGSPERRIILGAPHRGPRPESWAIARAFGNEIDCVGLTVEAGPMARDLRRGAIDRAPLPRHGRRNHPGRERVKEARAHHGEQQTPTNHGKYRQGERWRDPFHGREIPSCGRDEYKTPTRPESQVDPAPVRGNVALLHRSPAATSVMRSGTTRAAATSYRPRPDCFTLPAPRSSRR